jgi:hypothetical protein
MSLKPLPVGPGLPVSYGSPVGDEGAPGLLLILVATNEEAVCTDHRDCHPYPHIIHHLKILTILLAGQVGGSLFSAFRALRLAMPSKE